jgi:hypothetical protein
MTKTKAKAAIAAPITIDVRAIDCARGSTTPSREPIAKILRFTAEVITSMAITVLSIFLFVSIE